MLTSKEFAKMLNVSQSTVSRALSGSNQVSEETRRYISQKAEEVGFVLNSQAQSLKMKKAGTIGILFPAYFESLSKNMMFTHIYDCILKRLLEINYDVMIIYDENPGSKLTVLERIIKSRKVDGFISLHTTLTDNEVEMITKYHFPCVGIFQTPDSEYAINQFGCDEYMIGRVAGKYYAKLKEHRVAYLGTKMNERSFSERLRGLRTALAEEKRDVEKVIISDLSMKTAYQAVKELQDWLKEGKTALFVYNDMMALGAVRAILDMGLSIPEQVEIIGVDDVPISNWLPPYLSTIHLPVEEMVTESCDKLYSLLNNDNPPSPETVYYQPSLIHRDTTSLHTL